MELNGEERGTGEGWLGVGMRLLASRLGPPHSSLCPTDADHNLYIFKGSHYWVVPASGNASDPRPLQTRWPGLPAGIDACAWSQRSGKFYFFKGR